ncbi:MAG: VWA domain-containing protein [Bacteroidetes bacterium]|nr:VWA domain-containing protein [Bacteroidota bacterium]MCL6102996.1 VWA domain-containing protein [Bacteroidota bacterium]
MSLLDAVSIPRRTMALFFLVDTSGSMSGDKIGAVNEAIREVIPEIKDISAENADALIKIAVLQFSSGAQWLYEKPVDSDQFVWNNLEAGGLTDMGVAFKMLNEKLSRNQFMADAIGSYAPAIFMMSDGEPTDEYKKGLEELRKNKWFKVAIKVAVAIGADANTEILKEFTGNEECVLTVRSPQALRKMIRFASVTASQIGSKSSGVGADSADDSNQKAADFAGQMKTFQQDNTDLGGIQEGW